MSKPLELERAELIIGLCERFHCLPSALLQEDISFLRDIALVALAHPSEQS